MYRITSYINKSFFLENYMHPIFYACKNTKSIDVVNVVPMTCGIYLLNGNRFYVFRK